ncbi:MAG: hypothetical protein OEQ13_09930 [Acidobacteriota bacterium]|nr:hypothetical protein [Acidobacteriota bacterium]
MMNSRPSTRGLFRAPAFALALATTLAAALPLASAGELTLTWPSLSDAMTAGYEVELLDLEHRVIRVLDAEDDTTLSVGGLEDGRVYGFRIRPYDRFGQKARQASAPIESMPSPRIDGVVTAPLGDGLAVVTVTGANFDAGSYVVPRVPSVEVLETVVEGHQQLQAKVRLGGDGLPLQSEELLVVNPVRKGMSYIARHPEVVDLDGSGKVDLQDLAMIEGLFGVTRDDPRYHSALDPNDDGVIDGEDRELAKVLMGGAKRGRDRRP